jgi:hypothetical protein
VVICNSDVQPSAPFAMKARHVCIECDLQAAFYIECMCLWHAGWIEHVEARKQSAAQLDKLHGLKFAVRHAPGKLQQQPSRLQPIDTVNTIVKGDFDSDWLAAFGGQKGPKRIRAKPDCKLTKPQKTLKQYGCALLFLVHAAKSLH